MVQKVEAAYAITHNPEWKSGGYLWSGWVRNHWPAEVIQPGLRFYGFDKKSRKCFALMKVVKGRSFSYESKTEFSRRVRTLIGKDTSDHREWLARIPKKGVGFAIGYDVIKPVNLLIKGRFPRLGWKKLIQDDVVGVPSGDFADLYGEGGKVWRKHLKIERNSRLREKSKEYWKNRLKGRLRCCVCRFDFSRTYPGHGEDFIEMHHEIPVSSGPAKNRVQDLVPLCSNCHRMIHRDPQDMLTTEELRMLLRSPVGKKQ
jgi:putative restriction endonuclease